MPITFACPLCGKSLAFRDDAAGKLGQCTKCREKVRIPGVRPQAAELAAGTKELKKDGDVISGDLTEDGLRDTEEAVQKLTDRFVKSVDDHLERKEAEVMKV